VLPKSTQKGPQWGRRLLIGVGFAFFVYIIMLLIANTANLVNTIALVPPIIWLALLALSCGNYVIRFWKWDYLTKGLKLKIPLKTQSKIFFGGFLFSITPGKIGEAMRAFMLNRETGRKVSELVTLSLFDRLSDLLGVSILALFGLATLLPRTFSTAILLVIAAFMIVAVVISQRRFYRLISPKLQGRSRTVRIVDTILETSANKLGGVRLLVCVTVSIFSWSLEGIGLWLLLQVLGFPASVGIALLMYFTATIAGTLSFLPGGLGATEVVLTAFFLASFIMTIETAMAITIVIRATTLWFGTVIGAIAYGIWLRTTRRISPSKATHQPTAPRARLKISVVLPVFGETTSIGEVVKTLFQRIGQHIYEVIIVISPRSPRETFRYCQCVRSEYGDKIVLTVQKKNPGLGRAVVQGIRMARGSHILMIDSDGELDPRDSAKMVDELVQSTSDLVVASRWIRGGGVRGYSSFKRIFTKAFSTVFRLLFRTGIHDLSLGYKLIVNDARLKHMRLEGNFHDIATETTLRPIWMGFKASEVPTVWVKRVAGKSKNPIRNNLLYIKMALRILFGSRTYSRRSAP